MLTRSRLFRRAMAIPAHHRAHYETLGLDVSCQETPENIKKAYKRKAKTTHPDVKGGNEATFKRVCAAYAVLSGKDTSASSAPGGGSSGGRGFYDHPHGGHSGSYYDTSHHDTGAYSNSWFSSAFYTDASSGGSQNTKWRNMHTARNQPPPGSHASYYNADGTRRSETRTPNGSSSSDRSTNGSDFFSSSSDGSNSNADWRNQDAPPQGDGSGDNPYAEYSTAWANKRWANWSTRDFYRPYEQGYGRRKQYAGEESSNGGGGVPPDYGTYSGFTEHEIRTARRGGVVGLVWYVGVRLCACVCIFLFFRQWRSNLKEIEEAHEKGYSPEYLRKLQKKRTEAGTNSPERDVVNTREVYAKNQERMRKEMIGMKMNGGRAVEAGSNVVSFRGRAYNAEELSRARRDAKLRKQHENGSLRLQKDTSGADVDAELDDATG